MSDHNETVGLQLPPAEGTFDIHGYGVRLRPWRTGDEAALLSGFADAEFQRWNTPWVQVRTEEDAADCVRRYREGWERADSVRLCVVADQDSGAVEPDGTILGSIGLGLLDLRERNGRVGYWVLPQARGRGVARRALEVFSRWAFERVGLHRIELGHAIGHDASCRVAERCGYRYEGTQRGSMFAEGRRDRFRDAHMHARLTTDPASDPTAASDAAEHAQGQSSSFTHNSASPARR